jgi:hypothetical protein
VVGMHQIKIFLPRITLIVDKKEKEKEKEEALL